MNVNRRSWLTTDDYLAEKEGMQRANSLLKSTASVPQFGTYQRSQFARPAPAGSLQKNQATVQAKNPTQPFTAPAPQMVLNVGQSLPTPGSRAGDTAPDEQPLTQQQVNAQLTTAYTSQQMNEALQSLVDFNNRKFKYNAKESPLYTILEQQAAEEARLASGRAYARSVANTGGYGSSYATLAAEEASRQVMEGMNDQQYALYQAAKDEFEAERQSRLDWYNMTKQMHEDAMVLEEYEKLRTDEATTEMDANTQAATEYLQATYGTAYSEGAMRNDLLAKGYTEEEANAALEAQRKVAGAVVTDYAASSVSDAISNANTLQQAYANKYLTTEEYDAAVKKNAAVIMDNANAAMDNPSDADYAALGITAEEWNGMDEEDRKLEVVDRIGQLVKEGVVPHSDYYKMLYNDLQGEFNSEEYKESKNQIRDAMDSALVIQDLFDNGYLLQDEYVDLIYRQIVPKISETRFWDALNKQDIDSGGNKKYSWISNPFNALENYDGIDSYGSPELRKISRGLGEEHKKLLLELVREKRKERQPTISKPEKKGAT